MRLANGELRGVDADGEPAAACGDVIASKRALAELVEESVSVKSEGVRGNDSTAKEKLQKFGIERSHGLSSLTLQ